MRRQHKPRQPKRFGATVEVRNDDVNGALRKLRKILERDERQKTLAKNEYYEKPSQTRKRKKQLARKRWLKEVANNEITKKRLY